MSRFDAIRKAREWALSGQTASPQISGVVPPLPPKFDPAELSGIVNPDIRVPLNMMEVIIRLIDDSRMDLFKPIFGKVMITGWAYIHGKHHLSCT